MPVRLDQSGDHVLLAVKVVPGASRDGVVGVLGDRLKVRTTAPPEGGRANKAICSIIAQSLGVHANQVSVESGHATRDKTVRLSRCTVEYVRSRIREA